jgi:hypothetical protein
MELRLCTAVRRRREQVDYLAAIETSTQLRLASHREAGWGRRVPLCRYASTELLLRGAGETVCVLTSRRATRSAFQQCCGLWRHR